MIFFSDCFLKHFDLFKANFIHLLYLIDYEIVLKMLNVFKVCEMSWGISVYWFIRFKVVDYQCFIHLQDYSLGLCWWCSRTTTPNRWWSDCVMIHIGNIFFKKVHYCFMETIWSASYKLTFLHLNRQLNESSTFCSRLFVDNFFQLFLMSVYWTVK